MCCTGTPQTPSQVIKIIEQTRATQPPAVNPANIVIPQSIKEQLIVQQQLLRLNKK